MVTYRICLNIVRCSHLYVSYDVEKDAQQKGFHPAENIPNFSHRGFNDRYHDAGNNSNDAE
jgi:hypothetical protein